MMNKNQWEKETEKQFNDWNRQVKRFENSVMVSDDEFYDWLDHNYPYASQTVILNGYYGMKLEVEIGFLVRYVIGFNCSVDDFLKTYTYDDTEYIYHLLRYC